MQFSLIRVTDGLANNGGKKGDSHETEDCQRLYKKEEKTEYGVVMLISGKVKADRKRIFAALPCVLLKNKGIIQKSDMSVVKMQQEEPT